jgi:hypothetical protein
VVTSNSSCKQQLSVTYHHPLRHALVAFALHARAYREYNDKADKVDIGGTCTVCNEEEREDDKESEDG